MKKLMLLFFISATHVVVAQTNRTDGNASGISNNLVVAANSNNTFGSSTVFFNPEKKAEGSVRLFETWDNSAIIYTNDGQRFSLNNMNLNLESNAFESRVSEDSLFTFNVNNVKKVVVNNKTFKTYYNNGVNRIFQELYSSPEFDLLKGYKVTLVQGSANPMLNRSTDKYVQKEFYYLRQNDLITDFKLKKKNVMKLVGGNEETAKRIIERAKKM